MPGRIKNFSQFINESNKVGINEGFISSLKKYGSMAIGWSYQLLKNIINGLIAPIPYGPKKGLPTIMLFIPEAGPISSQIAKFEMGRDPLKEAELPLEYSKEYDTESSDLEDPSESIVELYNNKYYGDASKNIFIVDKNDTEGGKSVGKAGDKLGIPVLMMEFKYIDPRDIIKDGSLTNSGILPTDNGKDNRGGIIFINQMDKGDSNLKGYFTNLSKYGESDGYYLPSKWIIVASGENPDMVGDISSFELKK